MRDLILETKKDRFVTMMLAKYGYALDGYRNNTHNYDGYWLFLKLPYFNQFIGLALIHEKSMYECAQVLEQCMLNPITREEYLKQVEDEEDDLIG